MNKVNFEERQQANWENKCLDPDMEYHLFRTT